MIKLVSDTIDKNDIKSLIEWLDQDPIPRLTKGDLEILFANENPSAIILVSPLGLVPNMDKIIKLCKKYNVLLLEDVCESMGSKYKEQYLGTFGIASFFSMYFGHHLSTIEGGFINTNDEELYHMLLMMRSHGWDRDLPEWKQKELRTKHQTTDFDSLYNFYVPGFNLRSTDLQAFLGLRAIDKLEKYSKIRNKNFNYYIEKINNNLNLTIDKENFISSFAIPVVSENRNKIVEKLIENNIEVRPLIAGNMSNKPMSKDYYRELNNCNIIESKGFYIPNHQDLTLQEIDKIIDIIN
jgi:CDP-6-deoxy-D-xylo-4-hexulose-3-dehydrase